MSLRESFVTKILSFFIQPNAASNKTDSSLSMKPGTLILLICMALITTTGCLEQLYLKELISFKQSLSKITTESNREKRIAANNKSNYRSIDKKDGDDTCHKKYFSKNYQQQHHEVVEKLKRTLDNEMHFNKEMSSLSILLTATKTAAVIVPVVPPLSTICALELTTLETSVSCETSTSFLLSTALSSSSAAESATTSSVSTRQQLTKTLKSR